MSNQMTPNQARVIDSVLTAHARQYTNASYVLEKLFPRVPVVQRGGRVIKFNKDSFRRYNTRRAPGANTKRVQFGYASDPIALNQDSLEAQTPMELQQEAQAANVDLKASAVSSVLDILMLGSEHERGGLATDASSFAASNKEALSGGTQWSDSASKPRKVVNAAKEQVRKGVGHRANILVISPAMELALGENNAVRDQFKYTSGESITREMLARYFQVDEVVVPEAVSLPDGAAESDPFEDVWGNFALAAYVPKSVRGMHVPSFGYTYYLEGYPMVEREYEDRNTKSMIHPVTLEERPYLTAPDAGYLITNVLA